MHRRVVKNIIEKVSEHERNIVMLNVPKKPMNRNMSNPKNIAKMNTNGKHDCEFFVEKRISLFMF
jgi:hypothetical protein